MPHAGTHLPDAIALRLTGIARTVPDTDWHVDKLYAFARDAGATLMAATHSRIVVDLNRDPTGAVLYPGAIFCAGATYRDHAEEIPRES